MKHFFLVMGSWHALMIKFSTKNLIIELTVALYFQVFMEIKSLEFQILNHASNHIGCSIRYK